MAESLGSAVLSLRTDDKGLDRGIDNAEVKARRLGSTFDRTTEQGRETARAIGGVGQASDGAAAAMSREAAAANATVPALRNHAQAANLTAEASRKAAFQQKLLLFQLNDIGVSLASGMNPLLVMVQQGSQISQIYGPGEGGVGRALKETGNMIGGLVKRIPLLTAGVSLGALAIAGMTYEINQASKETVSFGDVALATWQVIADGLMSLLKPVIDEIAPWFQAAWDGVVSGVKWAGNMIINSFRACFEDIKFVWANFPDIIGAAVTGAVNLVIDGINMMIKVGVAGVNTLIRGINSAVSAVGGEKALAFFGFSGAIPELNAPQLGRFANPSAARLGKAAEGRNARVAEIMASDPLGQFYDAVADRAGRNARDRKKKDEKDGPSRATPKAANDNSEERFQSDMNSLMLQILANRRNLATTIEERYRLERQALDLTSAQARREVENNKKYDAGQKAQLLAQLGVKESLERELLARKEAEENAREQLQISQALGENQRDLLQKQLALTTARDERRAIELKMLESSYRELKAQLEATIASEQAAEAAKADARNQLATLEQKKALDRQQIDRTYESPLERYRREVGDVGKNLNDSFEEVQVNGLKALSDGLTDVIMGARSLGDVFKQVANQIVADLIRIMIQQLVVKSLMSAIGGGGGGGAAASGIGAAASSFGSAFGGFAGGFATGGMIPTGMFGIVGERGPEPIISTPRGALVRPNSTLDSSAFRPAANNVSISIPIDATGADPAALGRVRAQLDRLEQSLPGTIVRTMQEAGDRRIVTTRGWR